MARPTKQGIDYFPFDVQFDGKVELYILDKESKGLSVWVTLLQLIYQDNGYYAEYSKDLCLLIRKRINIDIELIEDCIKALISRGILNKKMFKKYNVLTSSGIQKRFFYAAKRKKVISVDDSLLLIKINEYINEVNVNINWIDAYNNATNKSKGKESKGKVKGKFTDELQEHLNIKIIDNDLLEYKDQLFEFYSYRMKMAKKDQYKTTRGINGLIRDILGCKEAGFNLFDCLEICMEKGWKTPDPQYFKNIGMGKGNFSKNRQTKDEQNMQACSDFVEEDI